MGKNFTAAFAVCLAISSLPLACGDDEDEPSGKGGSAGDNTGGKATGGTAGKGSGGSAGTGTGGSAGKGTGGSAGKGTGGTAGTAGIGGADGGMGGAEGGMGGEGGTPGPMSFTCAEVCARIAAVTSCVDDSMCEAEICWISAGPPCDDETQAYHDCLGNGPAANFSCMGDKPIYDYLAGGTCDAEFDTALTCKPI